MLNAQLAFASNRITQPTVRPNNAGASKWLPLLTTSETKPSVPEEDAGEIRKEQDDTTDCCGGAWGRAPPATLCLMPEVWEHRINLGDIATWPSAKLKVPLGVGQLTQDSWRNVMTNNRYRFAAVTPLPEQAQVGATGSGGDPECLKLKGPAVVLVLRARVWCGHIDMNGSSDAHDVNRKLTPSHASDSHDVNRAWCVQKWHGCETGGQEGTETWRSIPVLLSIGLNVSLLGVLRIRRDVAGTAAPPALQLCDPRQQCHRDGLFHQGLLFHHSDAAAHGLSSLRSAHHLATASANKRLVGHQESGKFERPAAVSSSGDSSCNISLGLTTSRNRRRSAGSRTAPASWVVPYNMAQSVMHLIGHTHRSKVMESNSGARSATREARTTTAAPKASTALMVSTTNVLGTHDGPWATAKASPTPRGA